MFGSLGNIILTVFQSKNNENLAPSTEITKGLPFECYHPENSRVPGKGTISKGIMVFQASFGFVTFCFSRLVLLLEYEFLSFAVLFIHYGFINGISSKLCEVYLVHEYICSKFSRFRTWHVVSIPCSWSSCWTKSYTSWHHKLCHNASSAFCCEPKQYQCTTIIITWA